MYVAIDILYLFLNMFPIKQSSTQSSPSNKKIAPRPQWLAPQYLRQWPVPRPTEVKRYTDHHNHTYIWGGFPLLTMILVRLQWGRYNLPIYLKWGDAFFCNFRTTDKNRSSDLSWNQVWLKQVWPGWISWKDQLFTGTERIGRKSEKDRFDWLRSQMMSNFGPQTGRV